MTKLQGASIVIRIFEDFKYLWSILNLFSLKLIFNKILLYYYIIILFFII